MTRARPAAFVFLLLSSLLVSLPAQGPAAAQVPPPRYTIEAIAVFFDNDAQTIDYTLRGHRWDDPSEWAWWSVAGDGEADTDGPVGTLSGWTPPVPEPYPDAALTRGSLGMVVWDDTETGELDTCLQPDPDTGDLVPTQPTPFGQINFAALDGRALPEGTPTWSDVGAAASGAAFTHYLSPSIALDVIGRGVLIWRELEFPTSPEGCWTFVEATTRIRYRVWDGDEWLGDSAGDVIPGTEETPSPGASIIQHAGYTDIDFTSVVTPGMPTRQQAIAVWDEIVGTDSEVCPGDPPTSVDIAESWPNYAVWDGGSFGASTAVPVPDDLVGKPGVADGPPFRVNPFFQHSKIGIAGDRAGEADLVFGSRRIDTLCGPDPPDFEVWTARWNDETPGWEDSFKLADGDGADVDQEPDDRAWATYDHVVTGVPDGVRTRTEISPGSWSGEVELQASASLMRTAVASVPHFGPIAAWHPAGGGPLMWSQKPRPPPGGTETLWSSPSTLVPGADNVLNVEMASPTVANWGFLVYGGGDNNLEPFLAGDIQQMEQVGSGPGTSIVVQVDDQSGVAGGTYRTHVIEHPAAGLGSAVAPDRFPITEPDMADPATLRAFLDWSREHFVADRYTLVMWDHGNGWKGVVQDTANNPLAAGDHLSMDELSTAFLNRHVELLAFDACLMAQLEVARQVHPHGDILVASQDCIPGAGYPYDTILGDLQSNPTWNATQLATAIVDRYPAEHGGDPDITLSAIRLNQDLLDLANAAGALAVDLELGMALGGLNTHLDPSDNLQMAIKAARADTTQTTVGCCKGGAGTDDSIDLRDFTVEINGQADIAPGLKTAIPSIQTELANVCFRERHGAGYGADGPACGDGLVGGLSIYFPKIQTGATPGALDAFDGGSTRGFLYAASPDPSDPPNHPNPPEPNILFVTEQSWDEFLYRYYHPQADAGDDFHVFLGNNAILDGSGSSDADDLVTFYAWDLDPSTDTAGTGPDSDTDRDGVDETNDDADVTGKDGVFPCIIAGVFPVHLTVRDDHESLHTLPAHYNSDSDQVDVFCEELTEHERQITLSLRRHLRARGAVTATGGFAECESGVPVRIQRKSGGVWKTIKSGTTDADGHYSLRLRDRVGRYRAKAPQVLIGDSDVCLVDLSPVRRHTHG